MPVAPAGSAGAPTDADPVWNSPDVKKHWDLSKLTPEGELRLGETIHVLIQRTCSIVRAGDGPRRLEEAAEPFLAALGKGADYKFFVIDSDAVNAFSHPGRYVYVTSGLLNWVGEDEPYVLEFVVGHEVAHIERRDALACLQSPDVKALKGGTAELFFSLILLWGYWPEKQDFDADQWAYVQMARSGRTKHDCLAFLRKFERYARDHGFENERLPPPKPGPEVSPVDNHYRSHPLARYRKKKLEEFINAVPARAR